MSLHASHPRTWRDNLYVYPVISRRAGGLSIGVNLNPDKLCNFNCIYCQVDRDVPSGTRQVDLDRLGLELEATLRSAVSGDLFAGPPFDRVPPGDRAVRDIAFSGDGEPTASPQFPAAIRLAADLRRACGLDEAKIILITNAACLDMPAVAGALELMDANNGEVWAKLDAGTEEYYRQVNRSHVPFDRILSNILGAARVRPIVIQSLWMSLRGEPPSPAEIVAFAERLRDIVEGGGRIRLVQVYTVARRTAEPHVSALKQGQLEHIADQIRSVIDLPVSVYGS